MFNQRGKITMCRMLVMKSAVPARVGQMTMRETRRARAVPNSKLSFEDKIEKDVDWMISLKSSNPKRFVQALKDLERWRKENKLGQTKLRTLSSIIKYLETEFEAGRLSKKIRSTLNGILNARLQRTPKQ